MLRGFRPCKPMRQNLSAFSGKELPSFRAWAEAVIGLNIEDTAPEQAKMKVPEIVNKYDRFQKKEKKVCSNMFSQE